MLKKILLLLLCIVILSCEDKDNEAIQTTWISGQVVNPKMDYIIFSQGDRLLDTVKLDSKNFFLYKTDKINSGLYSLRHYETQVFYIEPGDSLLLHVNTIDFDESLAYSGRGGEQNNLLMDLFLMNETENKSLYQWYSLPANDFEKKIDSLRSNKVDLYQDFLDNNEVSKGLKETAQASIDYDYFSKKEMYAAANANKPEKLSEGFFDYRKQVDYGNDCLRIYYPYYRFLNRLFNNLVYTQTSETDRLSFKYNYKKLAIIDSLIINDSLKNSLLRVNMLIYLLNAQNTEEEERMVSFFLKTNNNKSHHNEINELLKSTINLSAGRTIPNILLLDTENMVQDLHSIVTKPTVLFFWSSQSVKHFRDIHSKASELKEKYPEYNFIGINTDSHFKKWRNTIRKTGYNQAFEFQLENVADAEEKLLLNSMNKAFILNIDSVILESSTNLFNRDFEQLLLGYLNK